MKIGNLYFAGLDIETTGSDADRHGICQLGIHCEEFGLVQDICPHPTAIIDPEAMEVNKFTAERMLKGANYDVVDELIRNFLSDMGVKQRCLIPIGWNVAGFDMYFVRKYLPKVYGMCSYRSVDLNAVCFTIGLNKWDKIKERYKKATEIQLGEAAWHDAGYDAKAAYVLWKKFSRDLVLREVHGDETSRV